MTTHKDDGCEAEPWQGIDLPTLLDCFPFCVMLVDADHNVLLVNQAVRDSLSVDPNSILGRCCLKEILGLNTPFPGCPLEEAGANSGDSVECHLNDPETDRTYVLGVFPTPFKTYEQKAIYLHYTRDVTEQRRSEEDLQRAAETQSALNELLRISLEPIPLIEILAKLLDLVVSLPWLAVDQKGSIFIADENEKILRMQVQKGLDPQIQRACSEVKFGDCMCGMAALGHEIQFACRLDERHQVRFDGMPSHGQYCVPIVYEKTVLGVLSIYVREGHESTEREIEFLNSVAKILAGIIQRQRAEDERHQHELIALSRERFARVGEIAMGVAHTIRNPLHGVLSCVEILEQNPCRRDENVAKLLSLMREGLERISKTTQRLLTLASGDSLGRRLTSVGALIDDVGQMLGARVQAKGLTLEVDIASLPPAFLELDRVCEAITSVVGNAIDASNNGEIITIRALSQSIPEGTLLIEVEDRGEGISEDNIHRVLDPFFSTKPVGEGSGLGLALAQQVAVDHGGSIAIKSKEGEGTLVRMVFPGALKDGNSAVGEKRTADPKPGRREKGSSLKQTEYPQCSEE